MKKFIRTAVKFTVVFAVLATALFISPSPVKAANDRFTVNLSYGFGGQIQTSYSAPFNVTVTNNGSDFEGSVMLLLPGPDSTVIAHEQPLSLSAGSTKTARFTATVYSTNGKVEVRLINKKGKTVYTATPIIAQNVNYSDSVNLGVLTDDYSALSYLSGKSLNGDPSVFFSVSRLGLDDIPDDSKALEMLDVIIITNFSTDSLTDAQILSILNWAKAGGLLIIGTGDSAAKTLSGLDGFVNITTSGLVKTNTDFGINALNFSYNYQDRYGNKYYYNYLDTTPEAKTLYSVIDFEPYFANFDDDVLTESTPEAVFELYSQQIYEDYEDIIIDTAWVIYYGVPFDEYSRYSYNTSSIEDACTDFEVFAVYELIPNLLNEYYEKEYTETIVSFDNVEAILCELDFGTPLIMSSADDNRLPFASYISYGTGFICAVALDLTKAPFVNYPGNSILISHIIETLVGNEIYNRIMNYGYHEGNYNMLTLLESLIPQKLIPLIAYIILIFGYTIAAFILYFVLKKKNKSILIWPLQAGLAVGVSVLLFLVALTTKSGSASVSTAMIITDINGAVSEDASAVILMPKSRHYEIPFSHEYNVSGANLEDVYYYVYSNKVSRNDYTVCYTKGTDNTTIKYNALSAMSTFYVDLQKNIPVSCNVEFDCSYDSGKLSGHLTNNTGKTISEALVLVDFAFFKINELAPGETIDLSNLTGVSLIDKVQLSEILLKEPLKEIFSSKTPATSVVFGTGNKAHREEFDRRALFTYIQGKYLSDVPGYGLSNTRYSSYSVGLYKNERYLLLTPEGESFFTGPSGPDENNLLGTSATKPILVAFTENEEGVLDASSAKERVSEVIIVAPSLSSNFVSSNYYYGMIYYNGDSLTTQP